MDGTTFVVGAISLFVAFASGVALSPTRALLVTVAIAALMYVLVAGFLGIWAARCWDCSHGGLGNVRSDFFLAWIVLYGPFSALIVWVPLWMAAVAGIFTRRLGNWLLNTRAAADA